MAAWGTHTIAETFTPSVKRFEGMTVARAAEELGVTPFDALVEISLQDGLRTTFTRQTAPVSEGDWNARLALWKDPRVVLGASDAGAHLDMASTFRYTTAFLQESVRAKQCFGLEEAVHMLTEAPASLYGLRDRGVLKVGAWADLVVLEPDSVSPGTVHTRFDLPGGAGRLYAEAEGIDRVLVAGREVVTNGKATGELPGALLRSGIDSDTPQM
jgi:N-acyl-D-aspartate/D-glutamate deacylase